MSTRTFIIDCKTQKPVQEDGTISYKLLDKESGEVEFALDKQIAISNYLIAVLNPPLNKMQDADFEVVPNEDNKVEQPKNIIQFPTKENK